MLFLKKVHLAQVPLTLTFSTSAVCQVVVPFVVPFAALRGSLPGEEEVQLCVKKATDDIK